MKKPKPKTIELLDWSECTKYIEQQYNISTGDYARHCLQFGEWCAAQGESVVNCPPGANHKTICAAQEQYSRYRKDVSSGKVVERPYQNFQHWILDVVGIHGGQFELHKDLGDDAEPWQKEILALYLKEFGAGPYLLAR